MFWAAAALLVAGTSGSALKDSNSTEVASKRDEKCE